MKTLSLLVFLITLVPVSARSFTSADGKKTLEAELISYSPSSDSVVLRIDGQFSHTTAKASAFSEEDQKYFKEKLRESEKLNALEVTTSDESDSFEHERGIYIYDKKKEHFKVTIENRGSFDIDEVTAKYDIYVSKADKEGEKFVDVVSGESSIESIASKGDAQFDTSTVEINIGCSSTSSCPKCVRFAGSVERERVIGIRVRVYDADEELLTEYHSSTSTRTAAEKSDTEG